MIQTQSEISTGTTTEPDATLEPPLALTVDDDRITLRLLGRMLAHGNFRHHDVSSGEEALAYLATNKPDIILSDINMPGMDGIEFCRACRQRKNTRDIPVVFFTGKRDIETMGRAFDAGANDYVVKPIREIELLSRTRHHIDEYRRKEEAKSRIATLNRQNESKTQFLGIASHDLRNPLVSIRGISQYLESERFGALSDTQKEMVKTIVAASETMLSLVEDLLDVSKLDSDNIDLKREPLELAEFALQAANLHQPIAARKSISIEIDDRSDGARASFDGKLITRVIDNLVTNAIKFSPPKTRISIVVQTEKDRINLSVDDEGPGIPEGEFDRLFKEFSRTSNMPTGGESSSGIGLYVCRRIVHAHGGTINASNRPKGGASFRIEFERI